MLLQFSARQTDELSCPEGAELEILRRDVVPGCWLLQYQGCIGRVPTAHLAVVIHILLLRYNSAYNYICLYATGL
jgi:hypothetical protein